VEKANRGWNKKHRKIME